MRPLFTSFPSPNFSLPGCSTRPPTVTLVEVYSSDSVRVRVNRAAVRPTVGADFHVRVPEKTASSMEDKGRINTTHNMYCTTGIFLGGIFFFFVVEYNLQNKAPKNMRMRIGVRSMCIAVVLRHVGVAVFFQEHFTKEDSSLF